MADKTVTLDDISEQLEISMDIAHKIVYEDLISSSDSCRLF